MQIFAQHSLRLPPYAFWSTEQWDDVGPEMDEVRDCMLGWDVTDFGSGEFHKIGRTLFTLRNGRVGDERYPKTYAEKYIYDPEGQRAPAHYHRSKREDIIHRGQSGAIIVQLCATDALGEPLLEPHAISVDGIPRTLEPYGRIRLLPGQSLHIPPRTIHQFWGEEEGGATASGEVSSVCDDWNDNCFLGAMERFPTIDEDEPRRFYLCHEYPKGRERVSR